MLRKRFSGPPQREKEPRINRQITAQKVRVVVDGKGAEVMEVRDALVRAEAMGLDLVEISPDQDPPVCKIVNYGKYRFEQQKKKKDASKSQHVIHVKEIKLRPKIGVHDFEIKKVQTISFLEKGDKVKVTLRFRGREIAHPELGMAVMHRMSAAVAEAALVETPAKMDGKQIVMVLAAKPGLKKKQDVKKKPEGSVQEAPAPQT
ncbi:MAG: translation initiation factor IF-3 [Spirochaetia bacterium]|nr:translation initiation factor IF-3 [Spirochaetia bacterium]